MKNSQIPSSCWIDTEIMFLILEICKFSFGNCNFSRPALELQVSVKSSLGAAKFCTCFSKFNISDYLSSDMFFSQMIWHREQWPQTLSSTFSCEFTHRQKHCLKSTVRRLLLQTSTKARYHVDQETLKRFPTRTVEAYSNTKFSRLGWKLPILRSIPSDDQEPWLHPQGVLTMLEELDVGLLESLCIE